MASPRDNNRTATRHGSRRRRLLLTISLGLVLLAVAARFALPSYVRAYVNDTLDRSPDYDGRVGDIARTGFIPGTLVVPRFVLQELQGIADSADPVRRGRGRRGLDVLDRLQKQQRTHLEVLENEVEGGHDVDSELISAITAVHRGQMFVDLASSSGAIQEALLNRPSKAPSRSGDPRSLLSQREKAVLTLVAEGYTNQQVADRLCLSVKTIETYRMRLAEKLGLRTRADLTRYALEIGLIGPGKFPHEASSV